jgi:SAM-dependent methyltransferase
MTTLDGWRASAPVGAAAGRLWSVDWLGVEPWGAALYGNPCRECGFDWSLTPAEAVRWVAGWGARLAAATAAADGTERRVDGGWSVSEYASHVGDNLRQWAERLQSARLAQQIQVAGYDPDALAVARGYATLPLAVAVWSSELAATTWVEVLTSALDEDVSLRHPTRGLQRAADVARNNCHDAFHHLWDVEQILVTSSSARVSAERPFYSRHADAYDLLITDPVEPWVDAVHDRLVLAGRPSASVLDAGCGTGRHAAALGAKGHRVDLADASPELLARASARCPASRALLVDLCTMRLPAEYDAVTCRGVLNDMITDAEREAAVAALAGCLRPGGLLFLDVREADASRSRADGGTRLVVAELTGTKQPTGNAELRFHTRTTWERGLLRVEERYELWRDGRVEQESSYDFTMRPWSRDELFELLRRHGLRHVDITAGVGRRTADRLLVVAR